MTALAYAPGVGGPPTCAALAVPSVLSAPSLASPAEVALAEMEMEAEAEKHSLCWLPLCCRFLAAGRRRERRDALAGPGRLPGRPAAPTRLVFGDRLRIPRHRLWRLRVGRRRQRSVARSIFEELLKVGLRALASHTILLVGGVDVRLRLGVVDDRLAVHFGLPWLHVAFVRLDNVRQLSGKDAALADRPQLHAQLAFGLRLSTYATGARGRPDQSE